ncbi:molybdate ABC transporter substrate-binding protein [uncultured Psychrobacter sp.]|uniref:molybdate ABC transporter substrate-binding protein n=1 Tax=uncultured Psychrobacter sp. TaxID=259303 RepID=UPI003457EB60
MTKIIATKKTLAVTAGLVLALTSCTKENTTKEATDTASVANDAPAQTQTLRIAAAANLSDVLPAIVAGYQKDNNLPNQDIEVTYASSGKLYAQIVAGAPYDLFLSANQDFPAKLARDNSDQGEQTYAPFTYAQGQLALYSVSQSIDNSNQGSLNELFKTNANTTITIANPELAPYGASAKAYLQSQNLYDSLNAQKRLIQAENISQAFQYAHTGSVDYGLVAQSQIVATNATSEQFITLAPESYPPILQDGIVINALPVAVDFSDYLRSSSGQQYFLQAGYLVVE